MTPADVSIDAIRAARERLPREVVDTPLVPLPHDRAAPEIHLKLETLGPIGSFKLRGAGNALAGVDLDQGVWTASAGNMAQAVAWMARAQGVDCSVVVPDHAPEAKLQAIARFGAEVIRVPFDQWWEVIVTHGYDGLDGRFVHPVCDPAVIAGNGTIGLEILEQCPDVATVVVPYGGGGLSSGIAAALRAEAPHVDVFAAEVTTAAPLAAAFVAGGPVDVDHQPSFVETVIFEARADDLAHERARAVTADHVVRPDRDMIHLSTPFELQLCDSAIACRRPDPGVTEVYDLPRIGTF